MITTIGRRQMPEAAYPYTRGRAPAWARRALAGAEAILGAPADDPPCRTRNHTAAARRAERQAWFDRMRDAGVDVADAIATIGLSRGSGYDYERRRLARQLESQSS